MDAPQKTGQRVSTHIFTREQVLTGASSAFVAAYSPGNLGPEALRAAYDSLVIKFSGFEEERRGLYELPEARTFFSALYENWPYGLFFLNLSSADLKTYLFCRLKSLVVERRSGGAAPKVVFSRNELFQVIGRDFDPLEKVCQRAEFGPEVFRNRARRVLKLFGFLKK